MTVLERAIAGSALPFVPGARWGRYVLEERIASGGMAEVFRARRIGPGTFARPVCLKRLHASLHLDARVRALFLDEALLGSRLRHKNIVTVEDLGEHRGRLFIAMEYVHGVDLASLRRRATSFGERLPVDVVVIVARETLTALDVAHTAVDPENGRALGVIHRDVTPQNILVSFSAQLKLADFGVARSWGGQRTTEGRLLCGKPGYMPVEQACGMGVVASSDLFALGVTLYELLTGLRPYCTASTRPTLQDHVSAQLRNERISLRTLRPDVPERLASIIDAMVAPRATDRIPTARRALEQFNALAGMAAGQEHLVDLLAKLYPEEASTAPRPRVAARRNATRVTSPSNATPRGPRKRSVHRRWYSVLGAALLVGTAIAGFALGHRAGAGRAAISRTRAMSSPGVASLSTGRVGLEDAAQPASAKGISAARR